MDKRLEYCSSIIKCGGCKSIALNECCNIDKLLVNDFYKLISIHQSCYAYGITSIYFNDVYSKSFTENCIFEILERLCGNG